MSRLPDDGATFSTGLRRPVNQKRIGAVKHGLNDVERAVVIIIGSNVKALLILKRGIAHGKRVMRHFNISRIITAVANGDDILWRPVPAL